jgi:predicted Zn-dependent peptidase
LYAGVDPAKTIEALKALLSELARLRDEPVPEEELARAKALAKGRMLLRMEDTRAVSDWLGGQELLTSRIRTVDETSALIDAVTPDDLRRVAQRLIVLDQLNLAVVGPFRSPERFRALLRL